MTFSCYELQKPIELNENEISTLVIENNVFYRNFVSDILLQSQNCSSRFAVFEGNDPIDFAKKTAIITDIFGISFGSRAIQNKINQIAAEEYDLLSDGDLLNKINEAGAAILASLNFEADYDPIPDFSGIIKLFGFHIDDESLSLPERIIEYISFLNQYCEKKLFILLNLKTVLNKSEFREFVKMVQYKKICVFLIENHMSEITDKSEKIRIIDKDLCEF